MTKKELIAELEGQGVEFDPGKTKKELESLLEVLPFDATKEVFKVDKYQASYFSKGREHILGMFATQADAEKALDRAGAYSRKIKHITK